MLHIIAIDYDSAHAYTVTNATFWCNCCMRRGPMTNPTMTETIAAAGIADRAHRRHGARGARRPSAAGCARRWLSPARRSSPRSPTWIREISRPTSRPARNTATGCFGWCCSPTSSRCCSRGFRPSSASSPAATSPNCAAITFRARWSGRCGWSARSPPWRPISPSFSAAPSGCRCCSRCRSSPEWSSPRSSPTAC